MIIIDENKCIGCGQCVKVCPFTVLEIDDNKKARNTGKRCIKCMHCAAICPQDAITYGQENAVVEETKALPEDCVDTLETLIKQRRSYRRFKNKKVDREEIRHILEVADLVPSAKNQHPTNWVVIDNDAVTEQIMEKVLEFCKSKNILLEIPKEYENGNNPVLGENASVLIGYCNEDAINGVTDTAIAMTSIELMMQARNIGTCWGGYLVHFLNMIPECKELAGIPQEAKVYGTLLFGYPKQNEYKYVPSRLDPAKVKFV